MFYELFARIPRPRIGQMGRWRSPKERSAPLASDASFEIFRRLRGGPMLVERVDGIAEAWDRMKQIAKERPGVRYFVSDTKTQAVVAEIDATIPPKRRWRRVVVR